MSGPGPDDRGPPERNLEAGREAPAGGGSYGRYHLGLAGQDLAGLTIWRVRLARTLLALPRYGRTSPSPFTRVLEEGRERC
jgi:hypothetical protein